MQRSNEEELELFADLLEPAAEILSDKEIVTVLQSGEKPIKAVVLAIKHHKSAIIEILARIDGVDPAEYKVNALTLPVKVINLLNHPELQELFTLQGQTSTAESAGSAMESTEDGAN